MFRITIKINAHEKPDYEQIHAILESRGFSTRHRKGSRTMCYSYGGDLTMEAVFELVTGIVSRLYKQFFVFVHEVDGRRGIGMAG